MMPKASEMPRREARELEIEEVTLDVSRPSSGGMGISISTISSYSSVGSCFSTAGCILSNPDRPIG